MVLTEIKDGKRVRGDLLDLTTLLDGMTYTKKAFCVKAEQKMAKNEKGFVRFYLKDINSNVVIARLFDVKDFATVALKLPSMKNCFVNLTFTVSIFAGEVNLVIDQEKGITVCSPEEVEGVDTTSFVGKYDVDLVSLENEISGIVDGWEMPTEYVRKTFLNIGGCKQGAYAKIFELAYNQLRAYRTLNGVNYEELIKVFLQTMAINYEIQVAIEKYGFLKDVKILDIITELHGTNEASELRGKVLDAIRPLARLSKAQQLEGRLINQAISNATLALDLVDANNKLVLGMSVNVGGDILLKA